MDVVIVHRMTNTTPKMRSANRSGPSATTTAATTNEVRLVGRVAAPASTRELPSGDTVTVLRVVVDRPPRARRPRGPASDALECALWGGRLQQRAAGLTAGTLVEIEGALRRRFWRTPTGPASRYEVEVLALRRLRPEREATAPDS